MALSTDDTLHLLKIRLLLCYFLLAFLFYPLFPSSPIPLSFPPLPPPSPLFYSFFPSLLLFLGNLTLTLKVISSHGHRGLPTKMSPKFLFPDSIPFHLTSRKLLFDSSLCRRSPLFPMHMTVSKKTHCARRLQPLTRIFPRALYRAAAITRRAFRCLSSSFRRRKRRGWFAFSERPIKNRIKKRKKRERGRKEGTKGENRGGGKREFISVRRPSIE